MLATTDLSIGYRSAKSDTVIASGIDLSLNSGSLVSLIGSNGIGKSTLLRTLCGLAKPISGTVAIDGRNINDYTPPQRSRMLSVVLTEPLSAGNLTVFEIVALGRQPYTNWVGRLSDQDRTKVLEAISLAQIDDFIARKYYELSDGQLQKVLIARALAQDTPIIILDEPTTHLDLAHKVSVFRLLAKLARKTRRTILFSTHDVELALNFSDEMIVMTRTGTFASTPEDIVAQGILDRLFGDKITFDSTARKFLYD